MWIEGEMSIGVNLSTVRDILSSLKTTKTKTTKTEEQLLFFFPPHLASRMSREVDTNISRDCIKKATAKKDEFILSFPCPSWLGLPSIREGTTGKLLWEFVLMSSGYRLIKDVEVTGEQDN